MAGKPVKDMFFPRMCVVLAVVTLAGAAIVWALLHAVFPASGSGAIPPLFPFTEPAIHPAQSLALPERLVSAAAWLRQVPSWVWALGLLLLLPVVLSFGIDWAAGRHDLGPRSRARLDDQLDEVPRPASRPLRPQGSNLRR